MLRSELLGNNSPNCSGDCQFSHRNNMLNYSPDRGSPSSSPSDNFSEGMSNNFSSPLFSSNKHTYHISPPSGSKSSRKIPKHPFKMLDAPDLSDDFYTNVLDWSSTNILSVVLGKSVYIWSAYTSETKKFLDFGPQKTVCSIAWSSCGMIFL